LEARSELQLRGIGRLPSHICAGSLVAVFLTASPVWNSLVGGMGVERHHSWQVHFFVAPDGSDDQPGTFEEPFRTIEHARDVVRTLNSTMTGDTNAHLRRGDHQASGELKFGPEDSGNNGYQITYDAY